ncbi:MAG TPA: ATP phosphoribosyltransferase regulatory subunit [bacterium]|nr:ATP phosphoribosyltransferase regulatory subunit [bacterium]
MHRDPRERWQLIPSGTRDWLPRQAARLRAATAGVLAEAARWGYREVVTPTLEYLDVLVRGEGADAADRLFKLVDRGGELLALRPEMTTPVARLVATRLRDEPAPLRAAYAGWVFRGRETGAARLREFPQAGCELIGSQSVEADAEIVALAVGALRAAGASDFSLSLGHVGFLQGVLAGLDLAGDDAGGVRELLYQKDFVGLRNLLERRRAPAARLDALMALPALRGAGALEEARRLVHTPEGRDVVRDLERLGEALAAHGVADAVTFDLSIIRDFDYYTGIVFEGHTVSLGAPLLGGGRYDRLLERFGVPLPATGFAIRLERVLAAEDGDAPGGTGQAWLPDVVLAAEPGCAAEAAACARALRARGFAVALEVLGRPWDQVAAEAARRGIARAVLVGRGTARVREGAASEHVVPAAEVVADPGAAARGTAP